MLQEGEDVDVKILELKPARKRISLSIKEARQETYTESGGSEETDSGSSSGNVTLGDVFGDLFENAGVSGTDSAEEGAGDQESDEG